MSRLHATKEMRIAALHLPGDWRDRLDPDNVAGLVEELRAGRLLPPIRVRPSGKGRHEVVQGFHRVAAHLEAGRKTIRCDVVRYDSPDEVEEDQLAENLRRRVLPGPERDRALHRMVELRARADASARKARNLATSDGGFSSNDEQSPPEPPPEQGAAGRPPSPQRQAIKQVAGATGYSESTVERAVRNGEAAAAEPPANRDGPAPLPFPFRTFGLPVPAEVRELVQVVWAFTNDADKAMRQAQGRISGLQALPGYDEMTAKDLHQRVHEAAHLVRTAKPAALCPWCKGEHDIVCMACRGHRFATVGQMAGQIDPMLLEDAPKAWVSVNGTLLPFDSWRKTQPNGEATRGR